MSRIKKIFISLIVVGLLFMVAAIWYKYEYSMDKARFFEKNSTHFQNKLLIATQGSEFKNALTNEIVTIYDKDSIYIKVIDVSALNKIEPNDFNAILIIHTWENWKPPTPVEQFIQRTTSYKDNIVVVTTSRQGNYKMDGVDAITGESKMIDIDFFKKEIIKKLNPLLNR